MGKKKKYYVIWRGFETGIYESWDACKGLVQGYPDASYKAYPDRKSAEDAYYGGICGHSPSASPQEPSIEEQWEGLGSRGPFLDSLAVDAACSGNPGVMEYQGVIVKNRRRVFHQGPFPKGTANVGEFLALVHGLAYLKQKNSMIPIYSDSRIAILWVTQKKAKTRLEQDKKTAALFDLIKRAETWLHNHHWDNKILKWDTAAWGEIPADFNRK
ncbi:MAG: ribonuclease H family protein [Bacteroidales bacterium]